MARVLAGAALTALLAPTAVMAIEPPAPAMAATRPISIIAVANIVPGGDLGRTPGEFQLRAKRRLARPSRTNGMGNDGQDHREIQKMTTAYYDLNGRIRFSP